MRRNGQPEHARLLNLLGRDPDASAYSAYDWSLAVAQARATRLSGRLALHLGIGGQSGPSAGGGTIPAPAVDALTRGLQQARHDAACIRWELAQLDDWFGEAGIPIVVLKGAAYCLTRPDVADGRSFNDIDIMVPRARLGEAEALLHREGWHTAEMPVHQIRYYRRWMHEVPALQHRERGTRIDLHHNILPAIDALQPEASVWFGSAQPVAGCRHLMSLCPEDMVIHAAVHLFRRGEFRNGLRDLVDMRGLVSGGAQTGADASCWPRVTDRATALGLGEPIGLAVRALARHLGEPIPAGLAERLEPYLHGTLTRRVLEPLIDRALMPPSLDRREPLHELSHWMLQRYPLSLWRKSIRPKLERIRGIA